MLAEAVEAIAGRHPEWTRLVGAANDRKLLPDTRGACRGKMEALRGAARDDLAAALPTLEASFKERVREAAGSIEFIDRAVQAAEDASPYMQFERDALEPMVMAALESFAACFKTEPCDCDPDLKIAKECRQNGCRIGRKAPEADRG